MVEVTCRGCEQPFKYEYKGGRHRYYCSASCRQEALGTGGNRRRNCMDCGESFSPLSDTDHHCRQCQPRGKVSRRCDGCGKSFATWRSQPRRFCSTECRRGKRPNFSKDRICRKCRVPFTAKHPRVVHCGSCVEDRRDTVRIRRYNISHTELNAMKAKHGGTCWICLTVQGECVDHDHETGRVRGWLCRGCNLALHYVERPDWWDRARSYLEGGGESATA